MPTRESAIGIGAITDHVLPFQRSELTLPERIRAIAIHDAAETHETGPRLPEAPVAVRIVDQREPSQASGSRPPVTTQNRRDVHDAAPDESSLARSLIVHREPFHVATIARNGPENVLAYTSVPVATQNRKDPHETFSSSLWPPVSRGVD
jgi:hypothetical protein